IVPDAFQIRAAGPDGLFSTVDDQLAPADAWSDGSGQINIFPRGFFDESTKYVLLGGLPYDVKYGDLNEDGIDDIIVTGRAVSGSIRISLGLGNGQFGAPFAYQCQDATRSGS